MSQKTAISCILDLTSKDLAYFTVLNALKRQAKVCVFDGRNLLVSDENEHCLYVIMEDLNTYLSYESLIDYQKYDCVKTYDETIADYIAKANHKYRDELLKMQIAIYTKDEKMAGNFSKIRPLDITYYGVIGAHYEYYDDEELTNALENQEVFGYFDDEELCGFIGFHSDGSIGMFRVFEGHQRKGIGKTLEAYMINKALDKKMLPFVEVNVLNEASLALQEKLGLSFSKSYVYWVIQSGH